MLFKQIDEMDFYAITQEEWENFAEDWSNNFLYDGFTHDVATNTIKRKFFTWP